MNFFCEKRGAAAQEVFYRFLGLLLAAIVLGMLLAAVNDTAENTLFEKNYIARDLSLLITTIYASPGELIYIYDLGEYAGKFDFAFKGSIITVSDEKGKVQYWYGADKVIQDPHTTLKNT